MTLKKYRRRCSTEAGYVYSDFRTDAQGAPSVCPNDSAHTLDPEDEWVVVESYTQEVPIGAESGQVLVNTGQHSHGYAVHMKGHRIVIPSGSAVAVKDYFKFSKGDPLVDYPVEIFSGAIRVSGAQDGDIIDVDMVVKDGGGPGVDIVAASFLSSFYPNGTAVGVYELHDFVPPDKAKLLPAGIYLRPIYTPVAALPNDVVVKALVTAFKDPLV